MKFVIATQELNYIINKVQNVTTQKPAMPILANFLLEARDGQIIVTATDLTVGIRCFTDAKVIEEGSTTLPAKKFSSLARELTSINMEITTNENEITEVVADSSRFKINGMSSNTYPDLPDLSGAFTLKIPQEKLKDVFFRTSFAVSREDNRYTLTGVYLHIENGKATFVGTDGKRLARNQLDIEIDASFNCSLIIPIKAVEEFQKCLENDGDATLHILSDKIAIQTENTLLVTNLLPGEYPDINRLIPEKTTVSVTLHREELTTLLRQVSLFSSEKQGSVKFSFTNGEMKIDSSADVGEGKVSMPVNYQGEKLEIGFNPNYYLDILRHCRGETVTMGITDAYNPGVITETEGGNTSFELSPSLYILMPIRVESVS